MSESPSPQPRPTTAFVSGPIEYPDGYFTTYYHPLLTEAINSGHSFVVGPAPGTDSTALRYLIEHGVKPSKITVYLSEGEEVALAGRVQWFVDLGGDIMVEGITSSDRDAAMTRASDYDILRYMSIEEQQEFYGVRYYPRVSATEKNDRRRKGIPLHVNHGLAGYDVKGRDVIQGLETSAFGWPKRMKSFFEGVQRDV